MASKQNVTFPSTVWTDIESWTRASSMEKRIVLERFYARYRRPLLGFISGFVTNREQAEDVLHDFMAKHLEGRLFESADQARGRFRSLLLTALKRHLISAARADAAAKRRPAHGFVTLDGDDMDGLSLATIPSPDLSAEDAFERAWLTTVLSNVLERLRDEYEAKGQGTHYTLLHRRVIAPILDGEVAPAYDTLAAEFGITAAQASNYVVTAKRAYQRLLKAEIREYVGSEKEVAEEVNDFFHFLQSLHAWPRR